MAAYIPTFQQHAVDGSGLLQLTESYLETRMCITNVKMRKKVIFAIAALKEHVSGSTRRPRPSTAPVSSEAKMDDTLPEGSDNVNLGATTTDPVVSQNTILTALPTNACFDPMQVIARLKEEFDRVDVTRSGSIPLRSARALIQSMRAKTRARMTFADVVQTLTEQQNTLGHAGDTQLSTLSKPVRKQLAVSAS